MQRACFKLKKGEKKNRENPLTINPHQCNICGPKDCAYFVSGQRTVFMYDVPNKRQIDCVSQRQQTSSFHGVNSGIIFGNYTRCEILDQPWAKEEKRPSNPRTKFTS